MNDTNSTAEQQPTPGQDTAAALIRQAGPGPLVIGGYAGTGKSWLACHLVPEIFEGKRLVYAAPTNKAARGILRGKLREAGRDWNWFPSGRERRESGFTDDISLGTVFSLLNLPRIELICESTRRPCETGGLCDEHLRQYELDSSPDKRMEPCSLIEDELKHDPRDDPMAGAEAIIVDEASMLRQDEYQRLCQECARHGIPLLLFGDPGQLPPVGEPYSPALTAPDIILEDIVRQEQGNPVIALSYLARTGQYLQPWDWSPQVRVHGPQASLELFRSAALYFGSRAASQGDMIICPQHHGNGPNGRAWLNQTVRQGLGFTSPLPQPGDAVVSLTNDRYTWKAYNGQRGQVIESSAPFDHAGLPVIEMTVRFSEHRDPRRFLALATQFGYPGSGTPGRKPVAETVPLRQGYTRELEQAALRDDITPTERRMLREGRESLIRLDYGYALTAWKAQGDEAPGVMVTGSYGWLQVRREAYLYTAITRAKTELAVF